MQAHLVSHANSELYDEVVMKGIVQAKRYILIATANVKNMMVRLRKKKYESVIDSFARLCGNGGEVKILHSGRPSRPYLEALHKHPELESENFDMRQCGRNHMKIVSIDGKILYFGSANLTGAGIGVRSEYKRNFEIGIVTHQESVIQELEDIFYGSWGGGMCAKCGHKSRCLLPISKIE